MKKLFLCSIVPISLLAQAGTPAPYPPNKEEDSGACRVMATEASNEDADDRATAQQLAAPPEWPTLDASARHEAMYRLALHHLPVQAFIACAREGASAMHSGA